MPVVLRALRPPLRLRFLLLIISVLAIGVGGCATPTLQERLSYLDSLKSRGTITEEEYAIMRRRLVETVDLAALRAPPDPAVPSSEPERPGEPLSVEWVTGVWRGAHTGERGAYMDLMTVVEFSAGGDQLAWMMTRRYRYWGGIYDAVASGTAVVRDGSLEMTGAYVGGSAVASDGTPVGYELRRAGDGLEGHATVADPLTRTLMLHRAPR